MSYITAPHYSAFCTDNVTRRFYYDPVASIHTEHMQGHVIFEGAEVLGHIKKVDGLVNCGYVFVPRNAAKSPIPKTNKWQAHGNCCALNYCTKSGRCVGGCKS